MDARGEKASGAASDDLVCVSVCLSLSPLSSLLLFLSFSLCFSPAGIVKQSRHARTGVSFDSVYCTGYIRSRSGRILLIASPRAGRRLRSERPGNVN